MEQSFSFSEILLVALYLGSVTYLLGLSYQLFVSIRTDAGLKLKQLILVAATRLLTITTTLFIWFYWTIEADIQFGPFLLPALLAEGLISPLFLKLFGYRIWVKKRART